MTDRTASDLLLRVVVLVSLCVLIPLATGCVRRKVAITSTPSEALVWVNSQEVGRTPLVFEFTYDGKKIKKAVWHSVEATEGANTTHVDPPSGFICLYTLLGARKAIIEPRKPAHHGGVLAKDTVPGKGRVFGKERLDIVAAMGAVGVAGDLAFPPGRERLVEIAQERCRLGVKRARLLLDIRFLVGAGQRAQFLGLALDLGKRLLEVEVMGHRAALRSGRPAIWPEGARFAIAQTGQSTGTSVATRSTAITRLKRRRRAGLPRTRTEEARRRRAP